MVGLAQLSPESLTFHIEAPVVDGVRIELGCRIEGPESWAFTETVVLPDVAAPRPVDGGFLRVARLVGLTAALSYYKTLVPSRIVVEWDLDDDERAYLHHVVRGGLSEFAYRNDLPAALTPHVSAGVAPAPTPAPEPAEPASESMLVAVGGGKDSIVTIESLRGLGTPLTLFAVNEYAPIIATAAAAGLPLLTARRTLDPLLFALNEQGAWNGHVPVTAVNSLIACLTALRAGIGTVVFSNEASASAGNLVWTVGEEQVDVNHQWSKGIAFEGLLRKQLRGTGVDYVSFLRPLTEIAIMRRFATLTDYHPVFTSCNRSFHLDPDRRTTWCGHCPKCLFVALVLAPFVTPAQLHAIFDGDPLAERSNLAGLLDLLALDAETKPFECVGEPSECRAAVVLLRRNTAWADHPLLTWPELIGVDVPEGDVADLFTFADQHFLDARQELAARAVL